MIISALESLLLALSLCADCFAVSTCSSIGLGKVGPKRILSIALVFGLVQAGLMAAGWFLGDLVVGYVSKAAKLIGFLLLLYVGGSMILESFKKECEVLCLNGLKNVLIGAAATSLDALSVGLSLSMARPSAGKMSLNLAAVFLVTILSVVAGMYGGKKIGERFGRRAELVGGMVLVLIGLNILLDIV